MTDSDQRKRDLEKVRRILISYCGCAVCISHATLGADALAAAREEGRQQTQDAAIELIVSSVMNAMAEPVTLIDERTPQEVRDILKDRIARVLAAAGRKP